MASMRYHFQALQKNINPSKKRRALASALPGELRDWLQEHAFPTVSPHTRLSGSYARSTAILNIKDIDVLLFLAQDQLERTPNAVLLELKRLLDSYPDAVVDTKGQRRSIRLEFPEYELFLDIVPAVAGKSGLKSVLKVPDRPQVEWIPSDPLGYAERLSTLNGEHGRKVVPLVKLFKAWRDAQMKLRRPKSYVLEVMVLYAVEEGAITLKEEPMERIVAGLFGHIADKYDDLMENGSEAPRIRDPQLGHFISKGWGREEFETFMRRLREADRAASRAIQTDDQRKAAAEWARVFGDLWPTEAEVRAAAQEEAGSVWPGVTKITGSGRVIGSAAPMIPSRPTRFHGGRRNRARRPRRVDRPIANAGQMRRLFSQFQFRPNRSGGVSWKGVLSPTPDSPAYRVRIIHNPRQAPRVYIDSHRLDKRCRHIYPDGALCLYWPEEWWWTPGESLAATIVPWIAFWLYYYEIWEVCGEWLGPSSPHGIVSGEVA